MNKKIAIFVYNIDPIPKARARINKNGITWTPIKTKDFEKTIRLLTYKQYKGPILLGPLSIYLHFFLKRPKTVKRPHCIVKPDLDNLIKAIFDSLNKVVWNDDAQIISLSCKKEYSDSGKIYLMITG